MTPEIAEMKRAIEDMDRQSAALRAKVEEREGRPRSARFWRIAAGIEEGSLKAAKLEARAESYLAYRQFYPWETAEEREAILDLVKATEESTMSETAMAIGAALRPPETVAQSMSPWVKR